MTVKSDETWASGGALPDVVSVGDPRLRRPAEKVSDAAGVRGLCDRMVAKLRDLRGAGVAANQLGETAAVVVIEVRKTDFFPDRPESPLYVMVNPEILEASGEAEEDWEGCFSVPGLMGKVARSERITVRYMTPDGATKDETFDGYLARVIQHECDHLVGKIFLDRMSSMDTLTTIDNYAKFHHPRASQSGQQ